MNKDRTKWSKSVLDMHSRQQAQVLARNKSLSDSIKVKREYATLRKEDQYANYRDLTQMFKEDMDRVKLKHIKLSNSNDRSRTKLEALQVSQRALEMTKKSQLFDNPWFHSLKPKNKLAEISYQRELLYEKGLRMFQRKASSQT